MEPSVLSLLPPILTIALAIATRKILPALLVGIAAGALLYSQGNPIEAGLLIYETASGLVIAEGALAEEMYILLFVVLLGVLSAQITLSGGLAAFSEWVVTKIRSRRQATFVPIILGIIIFFDDAFSSLVGGNISRTVTDRYRISRAKLSYFVDSTAAPVIILVPVSAWAAVTAGMLTGILDANGVVGTTGYEAFLGAIPANYYAISALLLVFAVAVFSLDIGPMRKHERRAISDGELYDHSQGPAPGETGGQVPARADGKVADLVQPVATLLAVTVAVAMGIGIANSDGDLSPLAVLANANVILALVIAGLAACAVSLVRLLLRRTPAAQVGRAAWTGVRSMFMAVAVLFLAWTTAGIISQLGVGEYVAQGLDGSLASVMLPMLLFILAAFLAFSMGSTFGTLALILPISAEIVTTFDPALVVPTFGAVLAGAVFGDHTSPLSDTTILSSIGSGVHLIDHVKTQLPYALTAAGASAVGYLLLGLTQSTAIGLVATLAVLAVCVLVLRRTSENVAAASSATVASTHGGP